VQESSSSSSCSGVKENRRGNSECRTQKTERKEKRKGYLGSQTKAFSPLQEERCHEVTERSFLGQVQVQESITKEKYKNEKFNLNYSLCF